MLTYRLLENYTDDVYQFSLASRKSGLYVERIQKRQDLEKQSTLSLARRYYVCNAD